MAQTFSGQTCEMQTLLIVALEDHCSIAHLSGYSSHSHNHLLQLLRIERDGKQVMVLQDAFIDMAKNKGNYESGIVSLTGMRSIECMSRELLHVDKTSGKLCSGERERERESVCVRASVCACVRACVCVCVCVCVQATNKTCVEIIFESLSCL